MNIRQAILKAADHIERNPGQFSFSPNHIPDCGTPACASGWIGYFLGIRKGTTNDVCLAMGCEAYPNDPLGIFLPYLTTFLSRMAELDGAHELTVWKLGNLDSLPWAQSAERCSKVLRLYADKYHPADKPLDPAFQAFRERLEVSEREWKEGEVA